MRVLILGGTIFLGRHVVDEALQRGHELTLFTRGKHGTGPMGVEHVAGDRADVTQLRGRSWDAAIDTSGYEPRHVKVSHALDIAHYVFVSSCNAYPDWPEQPVNEDSATWQDGEGYGPDKARCERIVLPDGAVVRAGLIVGPHDNVFRLPWWVRRIREGGPVSRHGWRTAAKRNSMTGASNTGRPGCPPSGKPNSSGSLARSNSLARSKWSEIASDPPISVCSLTTL
jgi:2'-hydroxyisoflavone reductase